MLRKSFMFLIAAGAMAIAMANAKSASAQGTAGFSSDAYIANAGKTYRVVSSVYVYPSGKISTYRLNVGQLGSTTGFYGWVSKVNFISNNEVVFEASGFYGKSRANLIMYMCSDGINSRLGFKIEVNGVVRMSSGALVPDEPKPLIKGRISIFPPSW
jgi:hypothetical protein